MARKLYLLRVGNLYFGYDSVKAAHAAMEILDSATFCGQTNWRRNGFDIYDAGLTVEVKDKDTTKVWTEIEIKIWEASEGYRQALKEEDAEEIKTYTDKLVKLGIDPSSLPTEDVDED